MNLSEILGLEGILPIHLSGQTMLIITLILSVAGLVLTSKGR